MHCNLLLFPISYPSNIHDVFFQSSIKFYLVDFTLLIQAQYVKPAFKIFQKYVALWCLV